MPMRYKAVFLNLVLLCTGCVVSSGPDNLPTPARATDLSSFSGCYLNRSSADSAARTHFLTNTIWPGQMLDHAAIDAVRVEALPGNKLIVSAFTDHEEVQQQPFVAGEDFECQSGQILLPAKLIGSGAREPGNVFIGAMRSATRIGIDEQGQGYVQETTAIAGTAFLVIPVAGKVNETTRFEMSPDLCEQNQATPIK